MTHEPRSSSNLRQLCRVVLLVAVAGSLAEPALAQPVPRNDPTSTHIFPAGGRRGTKVAVRIGTECAPPHCYVSVTGTGVTAPERLGNEVVAPGEPSPRRAPTEIPITYPREWASEFTVSDDAALGPVHWRIFSAQGGTSSRPFLVSDLPEHIERESNSTADRAERIDLPITVNGQICGERDVDYFRFSAQAGDVVSCEVIAMRIGSDLDPIVHLLDANGGAVPVEQHYAGSDPVLMLPVPHDGLYLLRVANVTFHGSPACVYRIQLTRQPHADSPAIARHAPSDLAATSPRPASSSEPEGETEPNGSRDQAQRINTGIFQGRFDGRTDEDWFRWAARSGQRYAVRCQPNRESGGLPIVELTDAAGKRLASGRSAESPDGVCEFEWQAPDDAEYFLRVRDMRQGIVGGPQRPYALSLHETRPDFALEIDADNLNIRQNESGELGVLLRRRGGFEGAVHLSLDGLPQGVSAANTTIDPGKSSVQAKLTVGPDVPCQSVALSVVGRATIEGQVVEQVARARHLGVDSEGTSIGPSTLERIHLTVAHKPLFRLFCSEAYQYAHRGSVYPYRMEIERLNGFDGPIVVQRGDRQNRDMDGIEMWETPVPGGATELVLPIYLPETMHINVQSQSQLYSQAYAVFDDEQGRRQSVLVLAERRNMLRTQPPVVKLNCVAEPLRAEPGQLVLCRFQLERTSNFPGPMRLQLLDEEPGLVVSPVILAAGETEATVKLQLGSKLPRRPLRFRATGWLKPDTQVISEAAVTIAP